tara:strand:- start:57 stop:1472 length:1416 start_codon:yes stop_codon:yes gene_type:complete
MAIREGSIMEGVFAMYCAAYLMDPDDGKSPAKIEKFIHSVAVDTEINAMATKGAKSVDYHSVFPNTSGQSSVFDVTIVTGQQAKGMVTKAKKPTKLQKETQNRLKPSQKYFYSKAKGLKADFSQVDLKIKLKHAEVGPMYGSSLQKILDKSKEEQLEESTYQSIKKKTETLVKANSTKFFNKLRTAKIKYLANNRSDVMIWEIDAAGTEGEQSGGAIKQDVEVRIKANGDMILNETLNFSLKSDSSTVHGGGVYEGIEVMYEIFSPLITDKTDILAAKKYINLVTTSKKTKSIKLDIDALWRTILVKSIPKQGSSPNYTWSEYFWDVLQKRIFGTGYQGQIQVVEMNQNEVREVTTGNFFAMRRSGMKLFPVWSDSKVGSATPGTVYILPSYPMKGGREVAANPEKDINKAIYKMRIKYTTQKEKGVRMQGTGIPDKMMIELGGAKSIIHDANFPKFIEAGLMPNDLPEDD